MKSIKVGGVPEHFNLPWHLAIEDGHFNERGVELKWKDFKGGTGAMLEALDQRDIDLAVILTEGAVKNIAQKQDKVILATYVNSPLRWGIFTPTDSEVVSEDDIFDKTYAISRFGSGSHLMAQVHALRHSRKPDELDFNVVRSLDGARDAFKQGNAQVFFWEYLTTKFLVEQGEFKQVGIFSAPWPAFVIVAKKNNMPSGKSMESILEVLFNCIRQFSLREDKVDLISSRYQMSKKDVILWLEHTEWSTDGQVDSQKLTEVYNTLRQAYGLQDFPPDIKFTLR